MAPGWLLQERDFTLLNSIWRSDGTLDKSQNRSLNYQNERQIPGGGGTNEGASASLAMGHGVLDCV